VTDETTTSDSMDKDRAFPTLTDAQIARITPHAQRRAVGRGDVLVQAGDAAVPFFIVVRGAIVQVS